MLPVNYFKDHVTIQSWLLSKLISERLLFYKALKIIKSIKEAMNIYNDNTSIGKINNIYNHK